MSAHQITASPFKLLYDSITWDLNPAADTGKTVDTSDVRSSKGTAKANLHFETVPVRHGDRWYNVVPKPGDNIQITIKTPNGQEKITGLEYQLRIHEAREWVTDQHYKQHNGRSSDMRSGPSPDLYKRAQKEFGFNEGWQFSDNPILRKIGSTK